MENWRGNFQKFHKKWCAMMEGTMCPRVCAQEVSAKPLEMLDAYMGISHIAYSENCKCGKIILNNSDSPTSALYTTCLILGILTRS